MVTCTIHLHQQLVERILPLVVPTEASLPPPSPAHCVYLVDEYYARGVLACLTEQISHLVTKCSLLLNELVTFLKTNCKVRC